MKEGVLLAFIFLLVPCAHCVCLIEGRVYRENAKLPTKDPCMFCNCQGGIPICGMTQCRAPPPPGPNCRLKEDPLICCNTEYECFEPETPEYVGTPEVPHRETVGGCFLGERFLKNGEQLPDTEQCRNCQCLAGKILCQETNCPPTPEGCQKTEDIHSCCPVVTCMGQPVMMGYDEEEPLEVRLERIFANPEAAGKVRARAESKLVGQKPNPELTQSLHNAEKQQENSGHEIEEHMERGVRISEDLTYHHTDTKTTDTYTQHLEEDNRSIAEPSTTTIGTIEAIIDTTSFPETTEAWSVTCVNELGEAFLPGEKMIMRDPCQTCMCMEDGSTGICSSSSCAGPPGEDCFPQYNTNRQCCPQWVCGRPESNPEFGTLSEKNVNVEEGLSAIAREEMCTDEDGTMYQPGERIPMKDACMLCVCERGVPVCAMPQCAGAPAQNCQPIYVDGQCCPEYQCLDAALTATYCTDVDGNLYKDGEPLLNGRDPCVNCLCNGGHIVCRDTQCAGPPPGGVCKPVYQQGVCCPTWKCEATNPRPPRRNQLIDLGRWLDLRHERPTPRRPVDFNQFVVHNDMRCSYQGRFFHDGENFLDACQDCKCSEGEVKCQPLKCDNPPRNSDCIQLVNKKDLCCPKYLCKKTRSNGLVFKKKKFF